MVEDGRTDPLAHHDSRPPIVEAEAVHRAIFFAEQTGGWVHIVHLSAPSAAELVREAKRKGLRVTAETCPQYLAMDHQDLIRLKGFAKCASAIRDREQVEELWTYVLDGSIDCLTSDHCGFIMESKRRGDEDIWQAPNGFTGVQTLLPVVVDEGRRRGLSWERIAELTATAPARLWCLSPARARSSSAPTRILRSSIRRARGPFVTRTCSRASSGRCSPDGPCRERWFGRSFGVRRSIRLGAA